jgi:RNA polymerase sigma-B factor
MSCDTSLVDDRACSRVMLPRQRQGTEEATPPPTCSCVDCLVLDHLSLANAIADRYRNRGVDKDDLVQVARLGLVLAAKRFDPARGDFKPFAIPTITGEIRRYFRDTTWDVRVPRRIQELIRSLRVCADEAAQELGHLPSAKVLARRAGVSSTDVEQARQGAAAYRRQSLDPLDFDLNTPRAEGMSQAGNPFETIDDLASLLPAVRALDSRDARILYMRFYGNLSQAQIANQIGVSQTHVCRLLSRILSQLRMQMEPVGDGPEGTPIVASETASSA